jgi:hypothetical protein
MSYFGSTKSPDLSQHFKFLREVQGGDVLRISNIKDVQLLIEHRQLNEDDFDYLVITDDQVELKIKESIGTVKLFARNDQLKIEAY